MVSGGVSLVLPDLFSFHLHLHSHPSSLLTIPLSLSLLLLLLLLLSRPCRFTQCRPFHSSSTPKLVAPLRSRFGLCLPPVTPIYSQTSPVFTPNRNDASADWERWALAEPLRITFLRARPRSQLYLNLNLQIRACVILLLLLLIQNQRFVLC